MFSFFIHIDPFSKMIGQALADLLFIADDRMCSGRNIIVRVHLVSRTDNEVGMRGKLSDLFQDHHRGVVVRNGNHDRLGLCNVGMFQQVGLCGIADRRTKT